MESTEKKTLADAVAVMAELIDAKVTYPSVEALKPPCARELLRDVIRTRVQSIANECDVLVANAFLGTPEGALVLRRGLIHASHELLLFADIAGGVSILSDAEAYATKFYGECKERIATIKALREKFGMSLKEAKDLVEKVAPY